MGDADLDEYYDQLREQLSESAFQRECDRITEAVLRASFPTERVTYPFFSSEGKLSRLSDLLGKVDSHE
jgi:hypothetical protein